MRSFRMLYLMVLFAPAALLAVGCQSIVAPGQTSQDLQDSGATKWALYEYDFGGSHYAWIPHWSEGLLHLSSPHASNAKSMDVLEFKGGVLVSVAELGRDRAAWAAVLSAHGKIGPAREFGLAPALFMAVTEKLYHVGDPIECVLFANGFPRIDCHSSPRCLRPASEIRRDSDVLYYFTDGFGAAMEVCIKDGLVSEIRRGKPLDNGWVPFYHPVVIQ